MKQRHLTFEVVLYGLIFLAGLGLRMYRLGQNPLTDLEALAALSAINPVGGGVNQPLYTSLTALLFSILGSGNVLARLIPALTGSLSPLLPALVRNRLGRWTSLLMALALAVDPAMLGIGRQARSEGLALVFLMLAVVCWVNRRSIWGGFFAGLALLSGSAVWMGGLGLAVALGWQRLSGRKPEEKKTGEAEPTRGWIPERNWFIAFALTVFTASTMFFTNPSGISSAFGSLADFIRGWTQPGGSALVVMAVGLGSYETLPLVLGIAGFIMAWLKKDRLSGFFARWTTAALVLALLYPSRDSADLLWVLLPLWYLAVSGILGLVRWVIEEDKLVVLGQAFLILVLIVFSIQALKVVVSPVPGMDQTAQTVTYLRLIVVSLVLVVLITFLVAWGWSVPAGVLGLSIGLSLVLLVNQGASAWRACGLGIYPGNEVWLDSAYPQDADLVAKTLDDASEWEKGDVNLLDVSVVQFESPALKWLLRNTRDLQYRDILPSENTAGVVITQEQKELAGATASYRGQDFSWNSRPAWTLFFPEEWVRWALFREAPIDRRMLILWLRSDVFPGS